MTIDVFKFNQRRNKFAIDATLENNMLKEEGVEFFEATTTHARLDAYIDFGYVLDGTKLKYLKHGLSFIESCPFKAWTNELMGAMSDILIEEGVVREQVDAADAIVCAINALKGDKLDENGKVIKHATLPNATDKIEEMLKVPINNVDGFTRAFLRDIYATV